jgi:hypothetical protein
VTIAVQDSKLMCDDNRDMIFLLYCYLSINCYHFTYCLLKLKQAFHFDRHMLIQVLSWAKLIYISKMFRSMETLNT